jgi:quercetin dioxygenase-like cupin family protein
MRVSALERTQIDQMPRQPFQDLAGVEHLTLWRDGRDVAGRLWLAPGSAIPSHQHAHGSHHVWVAAGRAVVDGRTLEAGSYWHVSPGEAHALAAAPDSACDLFYLYLERPAASSLVRSTASGEAA